MKRRLYLQIWGAFLLVAFACLLVAGAMARFTWDPERHMPQHAAAIAELVGRHLPPADAPAAEAERAVHELEGWLGVPVVLWDTDLHLVAASGEPLPPPRASGPPIQWLPRHSGVAARLADGRWVGGALRPDESDQHRFALALAAVFATMALGCYPIARRITRRLEGLRGAVESWGDGHLAVRAPIVGSDEVADLSRSFNAAATRIERLVDGQRLALASASHELRSPLARVRMALALLDDDDPDRHGVAEQAGRDIAELDALIGDLLLASRLDAERPLDLEPVELLGLAAEEAARVGAAVDGDARIVQGDPRLLRRLLRNLLENARRYSTDVEVVVGPRTIEVRDRGPGVPAADRERIFEPFYRPPGHREGDGGVGLGLSLVLSITIRHGGRVWVSPREGGGSVFTLELV